MKWNNPNKIIINIKRQKGIKTIPKIKSNQIDEFLFSTVIKAKGKGAASSKLGVSIDNISGMCMNGEFLLEHIIAFLSNPYFVCKVLSA